MIITVLCIGALYEKKILIQNIYSFKMSLEYYNDTILHIRGKVKMWRLRLVCLRLRRKQRRHGRQTQSLNQRWRLLLLLLLLRLGLVMLDCRVTWLLRRLLVPRQWTSLGLLYTRGLQVHVRVAHSLPVQLLLGPDHPSETDR